MRYDGYIFDIDGVLLDTSRSFIAAVVEAVSYATSSAAFTFDEVRQLKSIRGFNNDWNAAIAGASWVAYRQEVDFPSFAQEVDRHGGGMSGLRALVNELTPQFEYHLTRLVQEAYGGTSACRKLYGFDPEFIRIPGLWQTEVPMVITETIRPVLPQSGIVTGRNRREAEQAFELLGWRLPDGVVAVSDDPLLDKPNPAKLKCVIKNLQREYPLYVGDVRDDLELVKNYRQETGRPLSFCLVGRNHLIGEYDMKVASVGELLKRMERSDA